MSEIEDEIDAMIIDHLIDESIHPESSARNIANTVSNAIISASDGLKDRGADDHVVRQVRDVGSRLGFGLHR